MDIQGNPCSGGQFVDWLRTSFGLKFTNDADDLLVTCSCVRSKTENEQIFA